MIYLLMLRGTYASPDRATLIELMSDGSAAFTMITLYFLLQVMMRYLCILACSDRAVRISKVYTIIPKHSLMLVEYVNPSILNG